MAPEAQRHMEAGNNKPAGGNDIRPPKHDGKEAAGKNPSQARLEELERKFDRLTKMPTNRIDDTATLEKAIGKSLQYVSEDSVDMSPLLRKNGVTVMNRDLILRFQNNPTMQTIMKQTENPKAENKFFSKDGLDGIKENLQREIGALNKQLRISAVLEKYRIAPNANDQSIREMAVKNSDPKAAMELLQAVYLRSGNNLYAALGSSIGDTEQKRLLEAVGKDSSLKHEPLWKDYESSALFPRPTKVGGQNAPKPQQMDADEIADRKAIKGIRGTLGKIGDGLAGRS